MTRNPEILKQFDDDFIRNEAVLSHDSSLNVLTSVREEEILLGVFLNKNNLPYMIIGEQVMLLSC
jgi:hypothetical protein